MRLALQTVEGRSVTAIGYGEKQKGCTDARERADLSTPLHNKGDEKAAGGFAFFVPKGQQDLAGGFSRRIATAPFSSEPRSGDRTTIGAGAGRLLSPLQG